MTEEIVKPADNNEEKRTSLGGKTKIKYSENILPLARIKKIMRLDPQITDGINLEANYLVCTATEMFVRWLSKEVFEMDTKALSYENLAKFVQENDKLDFLHQILPHKIKVSEYKKKLAEVIEKEKNVESGSDVSSSEDEDEDEAESEEEDDDDGDGGEDEEEEEEEDGEEENKERVEGIPNLASKH